MEFFDDPVVNGCFVLLYREQLVSHLLRLAGRADPLAIGIIPGAVAAVARQPPERQLHHPEPTLYRLGFSVIAARVAGIDREGVTDRAYMMRAKVAPQIGVEIFKQPIARPILVILSAPRRICFSQNRMPQRERDSIRPRIAAAPHRLKLS